MSEKPDPSHISQSTGDTDDSETIVLGPTMLVLAKTIAARLRPGIKVTSMPGQRAARVIIGNRPLEIRVPGVHFENLVFVSQKSAGTQNEADTNQTHQAMIQLRESEATFSGCTFGEQFKEREEKEASPRTVLHWVFPNKSSSSIPSGLQTKLHNGRIIFENCVFGCETGTALHAEVHAAVAVELRNVLHAGGGPMLFLETPPEPDEPWRVLADHVTLRESGPFWACRYTTTTSGAVRIEANNSVFAPKGTQPLLLFVGENDPGLLFRKIEWTGQGTLVKKTTPTAAWQDNAGRREPLDDQRATIDGLIRSRIEFTGPADNVPTSNLLKTWDAPLTSEVLPGIDAKRLP